MHSPPQSLLDVLRRKETNVVTSLSREEIRADKEGCGYADLMRSGGSGPGSRPSVSTSQESDRSAEW